MLSRQGSALVSCPPAGLSGMCDGARGTQRRGSLRQPGIAFPCPPSLETLLSRHWKDLQEGFSDLDALNRILEFQSDELQWTSKKCGLWSLEYKREVTSPLRLAAAQGYGDCLRYLLEHGARPNLMAGGRTALHDACENGNTDCAELLLEHGASPGLLTEDGLSPLHLCRTAQTLRCAKTLVRYGAKVDQASEEEAETPLHVASRHGLPHHARLYLRYGANVNGASVLGETPLGTACGAARDPELSQERLHLCRLLLAHGADTGLADEEQRTPLHKAARNVQLELVELLLEHGAEVNAIDYNGTTPLSCVLQSATVRAEQQPHVVVQTLLNHGSIKVWPLALLKVHQPFYQSLFDLEYRPRFLQHLCRATIRKRYGKDCHLLVPRLPIPRLLQRYLLLEPEGFIY